MSPHFRIASMTILQTVHKTESSVIFKVEFQHVVHALKVYHMRDLPEHLESPWHSRWYCESKAYERLQADGVCEDGYAPKVFASFSYFDPAVKPEIAAEFGSDKHHPCALLLEWIEIKAKINKDNYTRERWNQGLESFRRINQAAILHRDVHRRNCIITAETPERILWIDYDVSQTLDKQLMGERERKRLEREWRVAESFAQVIEDYKAKDEDTPWG